MILRIVIDSTNYYKRFRHALSLLTHCPRKLPHDRSSLDFSTTSMFNCGVLKNALLNYKDTSLMIQITALILLSRTRSATGGKISGVQMKV